jgi:hypothetical protein
MFRLFSLLLGFDDVGLFLVVMGLVRNFAFVGMNLDGTVIVALNMDEIRFRGWFSHIFSIGSFEAT